jgi:hypothetical protein
MNRAVRWIVTGCLLAGICGCCVGPYRCWQNYVGWNDPEPDYFVDYPPPPVTTPPGPTTPAALGTPTSVVAPDVD